MFTSIRKYTVRRGSAPELARRVQEGFVPLVRQIQGFRGYYLLDGGPDVLITISMFDSADEALASNEKAADWVRNNVLEFTRGMPEVMVGDVLIAEVKAGVWVPPKGRRAATGLYGAPGGFPGLADPDRRQCSKAAADCGGICRHCIAT
jgi:hypothetical protein